MSLAPYAALEEHSRGRRYSEASPTYRGEYQRDRDRIVHSSAFRRLEYKTQVFVNHEGDMFRTRLTHSIEVAQIGRAIARRLGLNEDLIEAISLAHDLGHTPFGHAGQDVLNECMKDHGGFEHNLQSLRIVDHLEQRYAEFMGLNLTFETREGILKHCSVKNAKEMGDVGERFLNKTQPSLEGQAANIADAIAYNNHDIDDGLRANFLSLEQMCEVDLFREQYEAVKKKYPDLGGRRQVHEIIRRMINAQAVDLIDESARRIKQAAPSHIDDVREHADLLIGFSEEMAEHNRDLKRFLRANLYRHYRVHRMTNKAKRILVALFDAYFEDPRILPHHTQEMVRAEEEENGLSGRARRICDYVAGMTDRYAILEYERIYNPTTLT
ncbi:MAG: deoxyguanosinetriphosphate triphosphohydrolase [Gammaproteobacteria bacterium]|nr:deoxyguanosinetriphosphate triphosphohydrolase [Gammaproteobacteria bacterium]